MAHVEIYTDGSCKGKGRADGVRGGWAAILSCNSKTKELSGAEPNATNNRMELLAVISGMEALTKECTVMIHYDSEYMRNGITKWIAGWKRNGWKTKDKQPVKNQDLWHRIDALVQKY
jgi:ribonuclease HI